MSSCLNGVYTVVYYCGGLTMWMCWFPLKKKNTLFFLADSRLIRKQVTRFWKRLLSLTLTLTAPQSVLSPLALRDVSVIQRAFAIRTGLVFFFLSLWSCTRLSFTAMKYSSKTSGLTWTVCSSCRVEELANVLNVKLKVNLFIRSVKKKKNNPKLINSRGLLTVNY